MEYPGTPGLRVSQSGSRFGVERDSQMSQAEFCCFCGFSVWVWGYRIPIKDLHIHTWSPGVLHFENSPSVDM